MSELATIPRSVLNDSSSSAGAVLIIDDEAAIRESLETLLELEGYSVESAATADQGLSRIGERPFDLVLLDLAAHGVESSEGVTVAASYRDISRRVGLSKDTVGRRIRVLCRAGVVLDLPAPAGDRFEVRRYLLRLDVAGIELDWARRRV